MLLDDVAVVLVDGKAGGQSGLDMAPHLQAVEVDAWFRVEGQRALAKRREILGGLTVDGVAVRIAAVREFDFRARHVQKAQRVAVGQRARLVCADNVVGNGRDASGIGCVPDAARERVSVAMALKLYGAATKADGPTPGRGTAEHQRLEREPNTPEPPETKAIQHASSFAAWQSATAGGGGAPTSACRSAAHIGSRRTGRFVARR